MWYGCTLTASLGESWARDWAVAGVGSHAHACPSEQCPEPVRCHLYASSCQDCQGHCSSYCQVYMLNTGSPGHQVNSWLGSPEPISRPRGRDHSVRGGALEDEAGV